MRGPVSIDDRAVGEAWSPGRQPQHGGGLDMTVAKRGTGQTALVTGASGGIGLDLAECFARDGYDLILTARTADALADAAERLARQYGVTATPIALDLGAVGA